MPLIMSDRFNHVNTLLINNDQFIRSLLID